MISLQSYVDPLGLLRLDLVVLLGLSGGDNVGVSGGISRWSWFQGFWCCGVRVELVSDLAWKLGVELIAFYWDESVADLVTSRHNELKRLVRRKW